MAVRRRQPNWACRRVGAQPLRLVRRGIRRSQQPVHRRHLQLPNPQGGPATRLRPSRAPAPPASAAALSPATAARQRPLDWATRAAWRSIVPATSSSARSANCRVRQVSSGRHGRHNRRHGQLHAVWKRRRGSGREPGDRPWHGPRRRRQPVHLPVQLQHREPAAVLSGP